MPPLNVPTCLECGRMFCFGCITKWSNAICVECPLCRAKTTLDKLVVEKHEKQDETKEEEEEEEETDVVCDKNVELVKLIREKKKSEEMPCWCTLMKKMGYFAFSNICKTQGLKPMSYPVTRTRETR